MWTVHNIAEVSEAFSVSVVMLKVSRWKSVIISPDYFNRVLMVVAEKFTVALKTSLCHTGEIPKTLSIFFLNFSCSVRLFTFQSFIFRTVLFTYFITLTSHDTDLASECDLRTM